MITQAMQTHIIYAKSSKASDRVATHPHRLPARYRRFLRLLDGKRSVAELATVSRPDEIEETIAYLLSNGFIEKVGEQSRPEALAESDDPFLAASLTPDMFEEFKQRAVTQIKERFGTRAREATRRIVAANTPAALRGALRDAEGLIESLGEGVDPAEVRAFFKRIGANFV